MKTSDSGTLLAQGKRLRDATLSKAEALPKTFWHSWHSWHSSTRHETPPAFYEAHPPPPSRSCLNQPDQGAIVRVGRGLYVARGAKPTEHHSLAQASKRVPKGV
ncbi:MAG: hypothetical protein WBD66_11975, partial [Candidatus Acidiferrales bacterium]